MLHELGKQTYLCLAANAVRKKSSVGSEPVYRLVVVDETINSDVVSRIVDCSSSKIYVEIFARPGKYGVAILALAILAVLLLAVVLLAVLLGGLPILYVTGLTTVG